MSSALFGYEAYTSAAENASKMQSFYTEYLKAQDYNTPNNPNVDLDRRGDSVVCDPSDKIFTGIGSASTSTSTVFGDIIAPGADATPFLLWKIADEETADPGNVAAVYSANADKGSKVIFTTMQLSSLKQEAFRNAFTDRSIKWFDGLASSINMKDITANSINVYPNPADKNTSIAFEKGLDKKADLKVINAIGQVVANYELLVGSTRADINTVDMPVGLYTVRVESNGVVIATQKLNIAR